MTSTGTAVTTSRRSADRVGSGHRRSIGIGVGGDVDAHLDVVALATERVDRSIREDRRALEARPPARSAAPGSPDSPVGLGDLADVRPPLHIGRRERADAQRVTLGIDVVEQHVDRRPGFPARSRAWSMPPTGGLFVASIGSSSIDDRCRVLGPVAVDDRVVEGVDADVARIRGVDDGRRRRRSRPCRGPARRPPTTAIASPSGS